MLRRNECVIIFLNFMPKRKMSCVFHFYEHIIILNAKKTYVYIP